MTVTLGAGSVQWLMGNWPTKEPQTSLQPRPKSRRLRLRRTTLRVASKQAAKVVAVNSDLNRESLEREF